MKFQLITLIEILGCLPITTFTLDQIEADDVIAYISKLIERDGGKSIIYSTDKDFIQLISNSITLYNPVKKKTFNESIVLSEYGIHPKHFYFFRALNGDKSDNINGIRGVGETTIKKYLPEISNPDYSIDFSFIESKFKDAKKVPKVIKNILDNKNIVERNIQLMNLHDVLISDAAKLSISHKFYETGVHLNKMELTKLLHHNKLHSAFPNYDVWLATIFFPLLRFNTNE